MTRTHGNLQKYQNPNPLQQALIHRFLNAIVVHVKESSAATVLDVGCAEGFMMQRLRARCPDIVITGIDLDLGALRRGRAMQPVLTATAAANAHHLPFADGAFDLVMCLEVLEHLAEPELVLREIGRVSHRFCLFSVPHEPWFRLANFLRGKNLHRWGDDPEHVQHWNRRTFLEQIRPYVQPMHVGTSFPWLFVIARTTPLNEPGGCKR